MVRNRYSSWGTALINSRRELPWIIRRKSFSILLEAKKCWRISTILSRDRSAWTRIARCTYMIHKSVHSRSACTWNTSSDAHGSRVCGCLMQATSTAGGTSSDICIWDYAGWSAATTSICSINCTTSASSFFARRFVKLDCWTAIRTAKICRKRKTLELLVANDTLSKTRLSST